MQIGVRNMDMRYPIGQFEWEGQSSPEHRNHWIQEIEGMPGKLRTAVQGLSEEQLNLAYREGGWTIRQVVHHLADSHMNSYMRFKLALTEDNPTIKPYDERLWAALPDSVTVATEVSLAMIEGIHTRWVALLNSMDHEDFLRTFYHPENQRTTHLEYATAMYAWHGNHHIAHITSARERFKI
ncbi:metal-dependent hydrolase [Paenibacillus glucanolyticus]|uniref:Putative metal-dependent hydrolase AWU65_00365 n=2 Tax=Paenibacillus glucanolyticus TaxID=59843 RepID=A0A163DB95_9BACL|nr:metal-dependent hydrolase [Paenibacillus glucanolyticus]